MGAELLLLTPQRLREVKGVDKIPISAFIHQNKQNKAYMTEKEFTSLVPELRQTALHICKGCGTDGMTAEDVAQDTIAQAVGHQTGHLLCTTCQRTDWKHRQTLLHRQVPQKEGRLLAAVSASSS